MVLVNTDITDLTDMVYVEKHPYNPLNPCSEKENKMSIDQSLIDKLFEQAKANPRLRMNFDLRTSAEDGSQRMLNALMPGTVVAVHRHPQSTETVMCLVGRLYEVLYDDQGNETERIVLCPAEGIYGCVVPKGVWHTVEVLEPSVIFEAKDGAYGKDGSEVFELKAYSLEN